VCLTQSQERIVQDMDWVRDTTLLGEKPAGRSFFSTPWFCLIPRSAPLLPHIPEWRLVLEMNLNERLWIMGCIKSVELKQVVIKSLITSPFNASSLLHVSVPSCTATFSSLIKASFVTTVLI
jgi:hypothetical protein